ncbi:hypothetical protein H5410_015137 [Solanum commersonii]|uniref:GRF-type domain-containing protein n=1 Tax=Solanum commersonii TaxID=4109 RepID=A0A9J5ZSY6_SOLCO|nr:hypothetical protein H5410_015137 [Solanum commersonii]
MSNLSISTSSDANVLCRCGVNAELKISWTQLNTGHQFFFLQKHKGGCDYFRWYDDEIPPQAKKSYGSMRLITNINVYWCCTLENSWSNNSFTCCTKLYTRN